MYINIIFRDLNLEIELAISVLDEFKIDTNNSTAQGLTFRTI